MSSPSPSPPWRRSSPWRHPASTPPRRCSASKSSPDRGGTLARVIESLVSQIEARFRELSGAMSDPDVIGDRQRYAEVGREYSKLEPAAKLAEEWRRATDDAAGAQELLAEDGDDPEVRELLTSSRERLGELEEEIRI